MINKKGQVTIFIIIAVLIFAGILTYFILSGSFSIDKVPVQMAPVYSAFLECLEQDTETGISVLESQGGYIELPDFVPGSNYMPFSSQLNFLGNPIPYWYYVSGNNFEREQVPSKSEMEIQLEGFIEERFRDCEFQTYLDSGFEISIGEPSIDVSINEGVVEVSLDADLSISVNEETIFVKNHEVSVNSNLKNLYDSARKIYDQEQDDLFLEEYAIDNLRLYAPVDGVEISCSPLTWNADEVFDELQDAIEVNTLALGTDREEDYFNIDLPIKSGQEVSFLNSRNWPNSFEVAPSDEVLLTANPVGNQPGLGLLGFCYVPYHFVYNVKYPVLIQIRDKNTEEVFQFPMAVVIQGNQPREALDGQAIENVDPELCKYKNTNINVRLRDSEGGIVNGEISYECFGQKCNIGVTENGVLNEAFPQCVNGYVLARADGFRDARYLLSTVSPGSLDIVLEKVYEKQVSLRVDGLPYKEEAIISFVSSNNVKTIAYPGTKVVGLSEGSYSVEVQIYKNSEIVIGAKTAEQCINVPRSNILGVFGLTQEKCFDIDVPEQVVSNALAGGGKQNYFISESNLINSNRIEVSVEAFPVPDTIEQIQTNYVLFENGEVTLNFV